MSIQAAAEPSVVEMLSAVRAAVHYIEGELGRLHMMMGALSALVGDHDDGGEAAAEVIVASADTIVLR